MRVYDRIIFDELVAGRPVLLNEVGYLEVVTKPAQMRSDRSVSAPRRMAVYTSNAPQNARNVVDILISTGVEDQSAWDQYNAWLAESRKDGAVVVEGVGRINRDYNFFPAGELEQALNPGGESVAVKPRSRGWIWIVVVVLLLLILLFLRFCTDTFVPRTEVAPPVRTEITEPAPDPAPQPEVVPAETGSQSTDPASGLSYPIEGVHYVVAGVFDLPENADKYIASLKRTYPQLTPEKFAYPGIRPGRTMVTVFSSDRRGQALDLRRELAWTYDLHDFWLFPEDK